MKFAVETFTCQKHSPQLIVNYSCRAPKTILPRSNVRFKRSTVCPKLRESQMSDTKPSTATHEKASQPNNDAAAKPNLRYISYGTSKESPFLPAIRQLISKDLSEPYSIYVYRYFLHQWGHLCYMVHTISSLYRCQYTYTGFV